MSELPDYTFDPPADQPASHAIDIRAVLDGIIARHSHAPALPHCACCKGTGWVLVPDIDEHTVAEIVRTRRRANDTIFTHRWYLCSCSMGDRIMDAWVRQRETLIQEAHDEYGAKRMNPASKQEAIETYARKRLGRKPRRYEDVFRHRPPTDEATWAEKRRIMAEINRRIAGMVAAARPVSSNPGNDAEPPTSNSEEKSLAQSPPSPLTNLPPAAKIDP